jgi:hypothetical protein
MKEFNIKSSPIKVRREGMDWFNVTQVSSKLVDCCVQYYELFDIIQIREYLVILSRITLKRMFWSRPYMCTYISFLNLIIHSCIVRNERVTALY